MMEPRFFGLLGHNISYSLSPRIFNSVFRKRRLPYVYRAFDIKPGDLGALVNSVRLLGISGFNVTIPYKQEILNHIDELDKSASSVRAANLVTNVNGILKGFNMDLFGIMATIEYHLNLQLKNRAVAVIGAGGSARAVLQYLRSKRPKRIQLFNRTYKRAIRISVDFRDSFRIDSYPFSRFYDEIENGDVYVIINATPVATLDLLKYIPSNMYIFDLAYRPENEPYSRNRRRCDGKYMLAAQASKSLSVMCGVDESIEAIFRDLKRKKM